MPPTYLAGLSCEGQSTDPLSDPKESGWMGLAPAQQTTVLGILLKGLAAGLGVSTRARCDSCQPSRAVGVGDRKSVV